MNNELIISQKQIENKIFTIRGVQVMFDSDLAELYQVETKVLNQAVKRNIERFPDDFMFQLTQNELGDLKSQNVTSSLRSQIVTSRNNAFLQSQIATSKKRGGRRYLPFVFTEQGIAMLSTVLRSEIAIQVSIQIMQAFVKMRKILSFNQNLFQRIDRIEMKLLENDSKFNRIFDELDNKSLKPSQGIFFDGQIFDAYLFVGDLIRSAKESLILIDNYVDDTVLTHFTKRSDNVDFFIFTKNISKQLQLDIEKHNSQYNVVKIQKFEKAHDRFLIIDNHEVYQLGASLKDLGKKWFAFSKMDKSSVSSILNEIKVVEGE